MAVRKTDTEFTDAQGNTHKHFLDGRAEIYYGGYDKSAQYAEITDEADEAVDRRRFIRQRRETVQDALQVRSDPEIATKEFDPEGIPGIDLIDGNGEVMDDEAND